MSIIYQREENLSASEYIDVIGGTSLASKRPITNPARVAEMIKGSSLIIGARENGRLIGLARCMTDFVWVCYCADLAVRDSHQGKGIGRGLLKELLNVLGDGVAVTLIAYPEAVSFYERIGWQASVGFYHPRKDAD
jgi:GNAT superfamily N-acetyltransferase